MASSCEFLCYLGPRCQKFFQTESRLEPDLASGIDGQIDYLDRRFNLNHDRSTFGGKVLRLARRVLLGRADRHRTSYRIGREAVCRIHASRLQEVMIRSV